jgi:hypothetical protein
VKIKVEVNTLLEKNLRDETAIMNTTKIYTSKKNKN